MKATHVQSSGRRQAAYYEAGRAVAACCLGIRFSRATLSRGRDVGETVEAANLVISEALSEVPLGREQIIDRYIHSLLAGAVVARSIAASSETAASFLSETDRDCIEDHLRHRGGISSEAARRKHLAVLLEQAERLASRHDFQGAVEELAAELQRQIDVGYAEILQILVRHVVRDGD